MRRLRFQVASNGVPPSMLGTIAAPSLRFALATVSMLLALGCTEPDQASPRPPGAARLSLLAVGDTGQPANADPQGILPAIGAALAAEDRRLAAHAVILLGDNFYPRGLLPDELVARLRENVVAPFCHFLALDGPRSSEVADACPIPIAERHPIPVHAVLGNHDHFSPDSPRLQREVVPALVPAFQVPGGWTHTIDAGGVDLVLLDSQKLFHDAAGRARFLTEALEASTARWRVVVSHHPLAVLDPEGEDAEWTREAVPVLRRAVAASGRRVDVWLSGHEHSLQLHDGAVGPGEPGLLVIAGSGSQPRAVRTGREPIFASSDPGFARLDWVGEGDAEVLVVTLFAVDPKTGTHRAVAQRKVRAGAP